MIEPFENNHQSMQIGNLVIENQTDKVIIYGDIDLLANKTGFEQAKQLHELTSRLLSYFEKTDKVNKIDELPESKDDRLDDNIENPFL